MAKKIICIYKITSPTGRIYIGQSIDYKTRIRKYSNVKCNSQVRLFSSILKYGWDSHAISIIEECSIENLNNRERYWQDFYNSGSKSNLNCRLTKSSDKTGKMSDDSVVKMINKKIGSKHSKETIEKMKISRSKWKPTDETKKKISDSKKGSKMSDATKLKMSESRNRFVASKQSYH